MGVLCATQLNLWVWKTFLSCTKLKWKGSMSNGPVAGTGYSAARGKVLYTDVKSRRSGMRSCTKRQIVGTPAPTSDNQIVHQKPALTVASPMNSGKCSDCVNTVTFKGRRWRNEETNVKFAMLKIKQPASQLISRSTNFPK